MVPVPVPVFQHGLVPILVPIPISLYPYPGTSTRTRTHISAQLGTCTRTRAYGLVPVPVPMCRYPYPGTCSGTRTWYPTTTLESGEVQAALIVARDWQLKLLERINFIVLTRQVTSVVKKRSVKLPEIKLVTFKGEFDEWNTFWSSFRNNVDF